MRDAAFVQYLLSETSIFFVRWARRAGLWPVFLRGNAACSTRRAPAASSLLPTSCLERAALPDKLIQPYFRPSHLLTCIESDRANTTRTADSLMSASSNLLPIT